MGICDIFSRRSSPRFETTSYIGLVNDSRVIEAARLNDEKWALVRAKLKAEDEAARLRALTFVAPVKVINGAHHQFIEIGSHEGETILAPIALIVSVAMSRPRVSIHGYPMRDGPSSVKTIIVEMVSGLRHHVRVEGASADIMLAAIHRAWKAEPSHD